MPSPGIQDPLRERDVRLTRQGQILLDLMHHSGDQHYYETRVKKEHGHVICLRCGKIEEYFGEPPKEIRRQVEEHLGFEVALTRTEIGGYCPHCRALRAQEASKPANA